MAAAADEIDEAEADLLLDLEDNNNGRVHDDGDGSSTSIGEDNPMELSLEERGWASVLKTFVEAPDSGLRPVSDFEYVQFALATQGRIPEALKRMKGLQFFQSHYRVADTTEEAVAVIQEFMRLQPESILHLDTSPETGEGLIVVNLAKRFPAVAEQVSTIHNRNDPNHNWRIHVLYLYYALSAVQPNFQAIRQGIIFLLEALDVGWENFGLAHERQLHDEMWMHYPYRPQETRIFHCNAVVTMMVSLTKSFISNQHFQAIRLGCDAGADHHAYASSQERITLSELYMQPNRELAQQMILERVRNLMNQRRANQQTFRL